jgi:hypothetical protein
MDGVHSISGGPYSFTCMTTPSMRFFSLSTSDARAIVGYAGLPRRRLPLTEFLTLSVV